MLPTIESLTHKSVLQASKRSHFEQYSKPSGEKRHPQQPPT